MTSRDRRIAAAPVKRTGLLSLFALLFPLTLAVAPAPAFARQDLATEDRRWVEFTTESGLPSNHVYFVLETKDGTAWAGTSLGLAWYDGYRWCAADTPVALRGERVWSMDLYSRDSLLVNAGGGLYAGNRFGFHPSIAVGSTSATEFSDNTLLLCIKSSIYTCTGGRISPLAADSELTKGKTYGVMGSDAGRVYAMLRSGLYRWDTTRWTQVIPATSGRLRLKVVEENGKGTLLALILTPVAQRGLIEIRDNKISVLRHWTSGDYVTSADLGPNDEVVFSSESGKLELIEGGVTKVVPPPPSGFRNIEAVRLRPNGDIWVSTTTGLYLYMRVPPRWSYLPQDSLGIRNRIHEMVRSKDGSLWTATAGGLVIFRNDGRRDFVGQIDDEALNEVTGIAEDDDGKIWISSGASFDGTYCFDGSRWKHYAVSDDPEGVQFHKIRKDRQGRLWFLGLGKNTPLQGAKEPGAFVYERGVFTQWAKEKGLTGINVYSFAESPDGSLYFGSTMNVARWTRGTWQYLTNKSGLPGGGFTLAIDSGNALWIGDRNTGLTRFTSDGKFSRFTVEDGLVNDAVWEVKVGPGGKIWFSTDDGLGCYDHGTWSSYTSRSGLTDGHIWPVLPLEDRVYVGTRTKGVAVLNLNNTKQPFPRIYLEKPIVEGNSAYIRWSALMPWNEIPPKEILTRYRIGPDKWSPWSTARQATYDKLDGAQYAFEVQAQNLFGNFDPAGTLATFRIPPPLYGRPEFLVPVTGSMFLSLVFGALYLQRKRKHAAALRSSEAKFRRLTEATFEGILIHDNGHILDANQSILKMFGYEYGEFVGKQTDSFLTPESLEVARESLLADSGKIYEATGIKRDGSRIDLEVMGKTIPYDNSWASVTAVRDVTERKLAEQKLINYQSQLRSLAVDLESTEERERRRMATYLHDYIGQTLALCKIKLGSLPAPSLTEPQLSHLQEIRTLLEQMILDTQSLTFELSPPVLYELGFEEAIEWLTEQIEERHGLSVSYENDDEPKPLREEVKILLFHAVRELLVNVVKHAQSNCAGVVLKRTSEAVVVIVDDDGIGFTERTGDHAHGSPRPPGSKQARPGGGFGLFNIRERITQIGGRIDISPRPGGGTRVTLSIPLHIGMESGE
jgi:PAS domain S-box-containing protein